MKTFHHQIALAASALVAALPSGAAAAAPARSVHEAPPPPDLTYATPGVAARMAGYYRQKSAPSADGVMAYYSRTHTSHNDGTIWVTNPNWQVLYDFFAKFMPGFNGGIAYDVALLGDERSTIVYLVNSPELFGGEMHAISAVDFDDQGKITRFVDYWDGRQFGRAATEKLAGPSPKFPSTLGEEGLPMRADPAMQKVVGDVSRGLSQGLPEVLADRLSENVIFEDQALRIRLLGKAAVQRYFARIQATAPFGAGSQVRHIVGSARGGGYEWTNPKGPIRMGITALGLNPAGKIERMTVVYDTLPLSDEQLVQAQRLSLDLNQ